MVISRRQFVALGATGAAGALVERVMVPQAAAAADRMGGIHISVLTRGVNDDAFKGFPHQYTMTVYGPDHALSGMGWGGTTDLETQDDLINSHAFQSIFSVVGAVEGEVVKLDGIRLFSPDPALQGKPISFEANLATGVLRQHNPTFGFTFEGTGIVARI
jgi:hypothetical protein